MCPSTCSTEACLRVGHRHGVGSLALAFENLAVHLGTVHVDAHRRLDAEFHVSTVHFKDMHGDVIANGDGFAYSTA